MRSTAGPKRADQVAPTRAHLELGLDAGPPRRGDERVADAEQLPVIVLHDGKRAAVARVLRMATLHLLACVKTAACAAKTPVALVITLYAKWPLLWTSMPLTTSCMCMTWVTRSKWISHQPHDPTDFRLPQKLP